MKRFEVTMDKMVRRTTISRSVAVFMGIAACMVLSYHTVDHTLSAIVIGTVLLPVVITYAYLFCSSPVEYLLTERELIVKKTFGRVSIPITEIQTINVMNSSFLSNRYRTSVANSGVFGYMGAILLNNIHTKLYIKRLRDNILITRRQKPAVLISPNDIFLAIELMEAVERHKASQV